MATTATDTFYMIQAALEGRASTDVIAAAYAALDAAGHGDPVGDESDHIQEIDGIGTYVGSHAEQTDREIAVYRDGDSYVLVGDSHGPWAVRVR